MQPIRGLESRCIFFSIQRVVFYSSFPPLLTNDYRNGAKTECAYVPKLHKVVGQSRKSFLHKEKLLCILHARDKLVVILRHGIN